MVSTAASKRGLQLLVFLGWALLSTPLLGAEPRELRVSTQAFPGDPRITLAAILPLELMGGVADRDFQAVRLGNGAFRAGPGFEAAGRKRPTALSLVVRREVPELWQVRVPADVALDRLEVTYELLSARGEKDRLSHVEEDSELRVRVRPLPLVIVEDFEDEIVIQGGVVLELDVSPARAAGTYLGTLNTTVNHL